MQLPSSGRLLMKPVCGSGISWLGLVLASLTVVGHSVFGGPVTEWTRLQPFPTPAQARVLLHDGQSVVALCQGGATLRYASDGTWRQGMTPTTNELRSGVFMFDRYLAVGDAGTISVSDDGLLWEPQPSGTSANLLSVVSAGPGLLAMGEGGTLLRSASGSDWELLETPTEQTLRAAAYGDGLYVVVGDAGTVLTSADGTEWTLAESQTTNNLREVVFGNGVFIARGSQWVVVSLDGIEWEAQQPQGPDLDNPDVTIWRTLEGLAFGNGTFALSGYGTLLPKVQGASPYPLRSLQISSDGLQWFDLQDAVIPDSDPVGALGKVVFGNGVFVSRDQRGVFRSDNGSDWNQVMGPAFEDFRFESGLFLAVGPISANPAVPNQMFISQDGSSWVELVREPAPDATRDLHEVVYENGRFLVAGDGVNLVSPDGLSWSWQFHESGLEPHGIVTGNGVFVALSPAGTLLTSTDGLEWAAVTMTPPATFVRVRHLGDQFIAVGLAGAIATSPDGWNWVRRQSGVMVDLVDLATDGSSLVVVGDGGTILRSDEGAVWSRVHTTATHDLLAIAWGNSRWLALGKEHTGWQTVIGSTNGLMSWTETLDEEYSYFFPPLRFEADQFWAIRHTGYTQCVVGSADGLRWNWAPGEQYPPSGGSPIGFSDYLARPDMTVALSLPGDDSYHNWYDGAIWVTTWSTTELEADESNFWFQLKLRSITFGRGRFMVVGDEGVILASNQIGPVLNLEIDHAASRLRLTLAGPTNSLLRLESSRIWGSGVTSGLTLLPILRCGSTCRRDQTPNPDITVWSRNRGRESSHA